MSLGDCVPPVGALGWMSEPEKAPPSGKTPPPAVKNLSPPLNCLLSPFFQTLRWQGRGRGGTQGGMGGTEFLRLAGTHSRDTTGHLSGHPWVDAWAGGGVGGGWIGGDGGA